MCSMFCVLHVLVWNETSQMLTLFSKWIASTRPRHTHNMAHTCTARWNTLGKLKLCVFWWMDWWTVEILLLLLSCSHRLMSAANTQIYRLSWTRRPLIRCSERRRETIVVQTGFRALRVPSSHRSPPLISTIHHPPASLCWPGRRGKRGWWSLLLMMSVFMFESSTRKHRRFVCPPEHTRMYGLQLPSFHQAFWVINTSFYKMSENVCL